MMMVVGTPTPLSNANSIPDLNAFVENKGQWDPQARFLAKTGGLNFWVTETGFTLDLKKAVAGESGSRHIGHVVKVQVVGSRGAADTSGVRQVQGNLNFLKGEASGWVTDVPRFQEAKAQNLISGVDARYYSENGRPRYDLIVRAGTDPSTVKLNYDGAENLRIGANGVLKFDTTVGTVEEKGLFVYQNINGTVKPVAAGHVINPDGTVSFKLGSYDKSKPVVIDPIIWSSFVGGTADESFNKVTQNAAGQVFAVGTAFSTDLPTTAGAYDESANGGTDVYVAGIAADGMSLLFGTYLGGSSADMGNDIAFTSTGSLAITGATTSVNYTAVGARLPRDLGTTTISQDAFVTSLSANGASVLWSSRIGGASTDFATGLSAIGSQVYVVGGTTSSNFPAIANPAFSERPFQFRKGAGQDAWLARVNMTGAIVFSTFLGGAGDEVATDVATQVFDPVVTGWTTSSDFASTTAYPTAFDTTYNGGRDGFVIGITGGGNALRYKSYLGGAGFDDARTIAVKPNGDFTVAGNTQSTDFPLLKPFQLTTTAPNAFVTQFVANATAINFSSYHGSRQAAAGDGGTTASDITHDRFGGPVLVGSTSATRIALRGKGAQQTLVGQSDGYIVRLSPTGGYAYGSFIGGVANDNANGLAFSTTGIATVVGQANAGFPTTVGSVDETNNGGSDSFALKMDLPVSLRSTYHRGLMYPYQLPVYVQLDGIPFSDVTVSVMSDNPIVTIPSTMTVPAGLSYAFAKSPVSPLWMDEMGTITAMWDGTTRTAPFMLAAPMISSITTASNMVAGGRTLGGTVNLDSRFLLTPLALTLVDATTGDAIPSTVATIAPATARVDSTTAAFTISTRSVPMDMMVKVKGAKNVMSDAFTIKAPVPTTLQLSRSSVLGGLGTSMTGTVYLDVNAPVGGLTVAVNSTDSAIMVPATMTVPAGTKIGTFTFMAGSVMANTVGAVEVNANGVAVSKAFTVFAPQPVSVTVSPTSVVRGNSVSGTATISAPAPIGGLNLVLELTSPLTGITVPAFAFVPEGATTSNPFMIDTTASAPVGAVLFKVIYNGKTINGTFRVRA